MRYTTKGTCSRFIDFDLEDGIVRNVVFTGGCNGNLKGICALVKGMTPQEALKWVESDMLPYYPLGVYKDRTAAKEGK